MDEWSDENEGAEVEVDPRIVVSSGHFLGVGWGTTEGDKGDRGGALRRATGYSLSEEVAGCRCALVL